MAVCRTETGQSAVVVPVPIIEPVVSAWRQRFDTSAAQGMPAHITALFPFLPEHRLTGGVVARLRELCSELPVLDVQFSRTSRFPEVLYLDPEPSDGLRQLTGAIAQEWPEAPPYGGAFGEIIPHLTVAHGVGDGVLDGVEADVRRGLPLSARLAEARLYVFDGVLWRPRARQRFGVAAVRDRNHSARGRGSDRRERARLWPISPLCDTRGGASSRHRLRLRAPLWRSSHWSGRRLARCRTDDAVAGHAYCLRSCASSRFRSPTAPATAAGRRPGRPLAHASRPTDLPSRE